MKVNLTILLALFWVNAGQAVTVFDNSRQRSIPVEIILPSTEQQCSQAKPCPVAFLSAGYGVSHLDYEFAVRPLAALGYLVVAVGHELPDDPPLSVSGNLYQSRQENWIRGAETLRFLQRELPAQYPAYNFNHLLLIGHSNGGDISTWLANQDNVSIKALITLDHRRVPLPKNGNIAILSIRASDFPADDGVLPSENEQQRDGSCVIKIASARHNDMTDAGPSWLKDNIAVIITDFMQRRSCRQQSTPAL
ncbi:alpha/beta fold hydrolase [Bowmanella denitrificans]|uniref:Alpha/beta fold hydrolase n=1 Tax=Bowmanella denitrificans TaxID=366582 RepID=A0ABP3GM47_9ALTE